MRTGWLARRIAATTASGTGEIVLDEADLTAMEATARRPSRAHGAFTA